jgi:hypothetical protein
MSVLRFCFKSVNADTDVENSVSSESILHLSDRFIFPIFLALSGIPSSYGGSNEDDCLLRCCYV